MNRTLASLLFAAGLVAVPTSAFAASTSLNAECSYEAGVECEAKCTPASFTLQCAAEADVTCKGKLPSQCTAEASASCTGSCQGTCEGKCTADPPSYSCTADCQARANVDCSAKADSECKTSANSADCKAKAEARCKGVIQSDCDASCTKTGGTADCKGKCQASCSGSCSANAKVTCDGYLKCEGETNVDCETKLSGGCSGQCKSSGGALVCNGQVISFQGTIDSARAYLEAHGYAHGSSSASCSGNQCSAQAEGEAGVSCTTASGGTGAGTGSMLAAGLVGLAYAASQLRRRKPGSKLGGRPVSSQPRGSEEGAASTLTQPPAAFGGPGGVSSRGPRAPMVSRMANDATTWKVLPHRPIEKLTENLWRVEGDLEGMPLKRVMTIAKRADAGLVVHNAIALGEAEMKEIDAWGKVAFVLVPNGYHRIDAPRFAARYPDAKVLAPSGSRKKVAEVVRVDGTYEDFPKDDAVSLETLHGVAEAEGAMFVRSESGVTLVLNDAVFNMPHVSGFQGFVFKHVTQSSGGPRVSRIARLFILKDKAAFRAHLERLASTKDLRRVIVSHHDTITDDPAGTLRAVAATL